MAEFRLLFLIVCSTCFVYVQAGAKLDYLKQTPIYSKYAKLIEDLGQTTSLENRAIQTVLAPTNDAITAAESAGDLGADSLAQGNCIKNHLLSGNAFTDVMLTQEFENKKSLVKAEPVSGGKVYFNKYNNEVYVENAKLVGTEHKIGSDVVIKGIDKVLCPFIPLKLFTTSTVVGSYIKNEGATYFNRLFTAFATNKPGSAMLSEVNSYLGGTYFVPLDKYLTEDDETVKESLEATVAELEKAANVDKLEKVLESHIIMDKFLAAAFLEDGKDYQTYLLGKSITVHKKPADASHPAIVTVTSGDSSAEVIKADQLIGNGVVHAISGILNLLYKNNYAEIMTNLHTQGFKALIPRADDSIKNTLKNSTQNYTIFAVDNLGINDNDRILSLQSDQAKLTEALEMAIVPGQALTLDVLKTMNGQKITTENGEIEVKVENGDVKIIGGGVTTRIVKSDVRTTNGIVQVLDQMLNVGSSTVYDVISQDPKLSTLKKYFDDFDFADVLQARESNITVIGAENSAFVDARKTKSELDDLLKDTANKDQKYIRDMKQFLSLFILTGSPEIKIGMPMTNLEARKVNANDDARIVGFKGDVSAVTVNYKAQSIDLKAPLSRRAFNGQLVVAKDVLVDLKDIKTGQVLGAATAKLHTGLALVFMVFVMRFWW